MRILPKTLTLFTLGLLLPGCPLIAGIDHDYSAAPSGPDGSDGADGADANPKTDGGSARDGSLDGSGTKDGTVPSDARTDTPGREDAPRGPDGATGPDSSPADVVTPPVDACTATCGITAPPGWTLIGFDATGSNTCPTDGFTQLSLRSPSGAGSCACSSCSVVDPPSCTTGMITSTKNNVGGTTCVAVGEAFSANNGQCNPGAVVTAPMYAAFAAPGPSGGTCTANATATDPTFNPRTACQSSTSCGTSVCGLNHSMFKTCLYQLGSQTCPAGMTATLVGTTIDTTCDTCTCTATAAGCTGTFSIYGPSGCSSGQIVSVPADGTSCVQLTGVGAGDSYEYAASPTGVSCTNGTANPTDTVENQATICCP